MADTHPLVHDASCRNCSAALTGPYCAQCGQHAHESARSLHVLFHDAWHLITHVDGNLWRTLAPLLFRPGYLTREYFLDHRARYVPPFRLYFVISVVFFALASVTTTVSNPDSTPHAAFSAADRAEIQQDLRAQQVPAGVTNTVETLTSSNSSPQFTAQLCARLATGAGSLDQRLKSVCLHQLADQGKSMMHAFGSFVPKMMFVFLPLMALVMLALYHTPRRHYVEHLVFLLHLQSSLFLAMIVEMLLGAAASAWQVLELAPAIGGVVLFWYALWYICTALRGYYEQSWPRTLVKFVAIGFAYTTCFILALAGTMVISALVT
jgi:hypothetical protein